VFHRKRGAEENRTGGLQKKGKKPKSEGGEGGKGLLGSSYVASNYALNDPQLHYLHASTGEEQGKG